MPEHQAALGADAYEHLQYGIHSVVPSVSQRITSAISTIIFHARSSGAKGPESLPDDVRIPYRTYTAYGESFPGERKKVIRHWLHMFSTASGLPQDTLNEKQLLNIVLLSSPAVTEDGATPKEVMRMQDDRLVTELYRGLRTILEQDQINRWAHHIIPGEEWDALLPQDRRTFLDRGVVRVEQDVRAACTARLEKAQQAKKPEEAQRYGRILSALPGHMRTLRRNADAAHSLGRQHAGDLLQDLANKSIWSLLLEKSEADPAVAQRVAIAKKISMAMRRSKKAAPAPVQPAVQGQAQPAVAPVPPKTAPVTPAQPASPAAGGAPAVVSAVGPAVPSGATSTPSVQVVGSVSAPAAVPTVVVSASTPHAAGATPAATPPPVVAPPAATPPPVAATPVAPTAQKKQKSSPSKKGGFVAPKTFKIADKLAEIQDNPLNKGGSRALLAQYFSAATGIKPTEKSSSTEAKEPPTKEKEKQPELKKEEPKKDESKKEKAEEKKH